jgi:hypothetical protein
MYYSKANVVHDDDFRQQWGDRQTRCFACGIPVAQAPIPGCQVHHLIKGTGRSDEACNLVLACQRCHSLCHGARVREQGELLATLTVGMQLLLKFLSAPTEYDRTRLSALNHRRLPDELPLPAWLLKERQSHGLPCTRTQLEEHHSGRNQPDGTA